MPTESQTSNSAEGAASWGNLLGDLPQATQSAFEALEVKSSFPTGFTVIAKGQAPRGLFVLCRGTARLSIPGLEGRQVVTRTAREGEILGLSATVSGEPYEMTVETTAPCEVGFVARDDFLHFLRDTPEVAFRLVQILSMNLNAILEQTRQLR